MRNNLLLLIILSFNALAFASNPDERPSIELLFQKMFNQYKDDIFKQKENTSPTSFGVRFIIPTNDNISLTLGAGYGSEKQNIFEQYNIKKSSIFINAGLKVYLSSGSDKKTSEEEIVYNQKLSQLYNQAVEQYNDGQLINAESTIKKASRKDKNNPKYNRLLGDIYFAKEAWSLSMSLYMQTMELDTTQTDLYYKIGKIYLYLENNTRAINYYKIYLKYYPNDKTAWRELSTIYEASGNTVEAKNCYDMYKKIK